MKRIWKQVGITAFWLSWPLLYIYLRHGSRAKILVTAGDEVLVVKSWLGTGKWSLPGGGLHRGENPIQGVLRELQEETGVIADPLQLSSLFKDIFRQHRFRVTYECFLLELSKPAAIRPQRFEVVDVAWIHKSQVTVSNASEDVLKAIVVADS